MKEAAEGRPTADTETRVDASKIIRVDEIVRWSIEVEVAEDPGLKTQFPLPR